MHRRVERSGPGRRGGNVCVAEAAEKILGRGLCVEQESRA